MAKNINAMPACMSGLAATKTSLIARAFQRSAGSHAPNAMDAERGKSANQNDLYNPAD
jgi:hypothetical protein